MNVTKDQISTLVGNLHLENMALRNQVDELTEKLNAALRELAAKEVASKPVE